jgi:hypothetical protein
LSIFSNFRIQPWPSENSYGKEKAKENIDIGSIKNRYAELHDLYSSPSIIRVIKSRRMRWAGHAA